MLKTPSVNLFRGSFGENEVVSMILCIAAAVPFLWGIGTLFVQIDAVCDMDGVRFEGCFNSFEKRG